MKHSDLGDLVKITIGKTPSRDDSSYWDKDKTGNNAWLSIRDLQKLDGRTVMDSSEYISNKATGLFSFVPKDTLIVSFKLTLGRLAFTGRDVYTNEAIAALHNDQEEILDDYLYYYLSYFDWGDYAKADQKVKGLTLNKKKLSLIPIDYPDSISEQQRIVDLLDSAFKKIDKAISLSKKNLLNAKDIYRVTLEKIFKDLSLQGGHAFLPEIVKDEKYAIKRGPFGSALRKSYFVEKGYKIYEQKNAIQDDCYIGRYYINDQMFKELGAFAVKPGDILISCSGTIGRTTIVPENAEAGIINQALLKVAINPSKMPLEYFRYFFNWMVQGGGIDEKTKGSAIKNIVSVKDLKATPIPVPVNDMDGMVEVVEILDLAKSNSIKLEEVLQIKLNKLLDLKSSMLEKALKAGLRI